MGYRTLIAVLVLAASGALAQPAAVGFPEGWRDWRHVHSMLIQEGHPLYASFGGLHHIYANAKALEGYRSGRFPDGAVLVFDLFAALPAEHAILEGPRKLLGVMQRDAQGFAATGGWGFEVFAAGDRSRPSLDAAGAAACYQCHAAQAGPDLVFSGLRD